MGLFTNSASWRTNEHTQLAIAAQQFFAAELTPQLDKWIEQGFADRAFWRKAGDAGFMGGCIPEAYGGIGGNKSFDAVVLYELAATGNSSWGYMIQTVMMNYILSLGTEEQKLRWLPDLVSGKKIGAIAMTEPSCGSDLLSMKTKATKEGNQYRINGAKTFITHGTTADIIVLAVRTGKETGSNALSMVVIEADKVDGFSRGAPMDKLGMKGSDTSELYFEDTMISEDNLLGGAEGLGFAQMMNELPWERLVLSINALGSIDHAMHNTLNYVKERQAFGKRLMDFQNTRFKLAEAKGKTEMLRSFVSDCIVEADQGNLNSASASIAKYLGTELQNSIISDCLQLHGGYGYVVETPIARQFADARVQMIYGGSNEVLKELIAKSLDK